MTWQPSASIDILRERSAFVARIRDYFAQRSVMEVDTPLLARHSVTDPHLASLSVHDAKGLLGYLQTSPEYMMKRLLAAGSGCIYQINKAFRAEEQGPHHQPEFTLLEWYRLGFGMFELMDEVVAIINQEIKGLSVVKLAYQSLFLEAFGEDPLEDNLRLWQRLLVQSLNMHEVPKHQDDCLDVLMTQVIAPQWPATQITCVYDYPASQAALARLDPENAKVAKRFEVYVGAVELANGYHELSDAKEQAKRMTDDNDKRLGEGLPVMEVDKVFLQALEYGLPDCSGVAMGLDRLFMLKMNKNNLSDVLAFPR